MRNGILATLAALSALSGQALGQGYPAYPPPGYQQPGYPQPGYQQPGYPPPGYPPPGYYQPAPQYPHPYPPQMMAPPQMMPQRPPYAHFYPYAQHPQPMQPMPQMPMAGQPRFQGMPQGYGEAYAPRQPVVHGWPPPAGSIPPPPGAVIVIPETPQESARTHDQNPGYSVLPGATDPTTGLPVAWGKKKHAKCDTCKPGGVVIDPAPGTPMWCEDDVCVQAKPPYPHHDPKVPTKCEPRGYCGYFKGEGLLWRVRQQSSPILATFTTPKGTFNYAADDIDNGERVGARVLLGVWINPAQTLAFEAGGFWLAERTPGADIRALPVLRPIINVDPAVNAFQNIDALGGAPGVVNVSSLMRIWSAEANFRKQICCFPKGCGHLDVIAGFRYLSLDENLEVIAIAQPTPTTARIVEDRFGTQNRFYAAQIGFEGEVHLGKWYLDVWGKIAAGDMREVVNIAGSTVDIAGPVVTSTNAGLLTQATNVGYNRRDKFAYMPEVGVNVGYKIGNNIRVTAGYSVLYIANLVRPGDQIDRSVNLSNPLVGPARPLFNWNETHFWAQGISGGLEFRY